MKGSGPRSLADLLRTGDIGRLRAEALNRRTLTEEIRARLPAPLATHLTGAHREADGLLVLSVDSAAWAARLRFVADEAGLGAVSVRVAPPDPDQSGSPGAS